MMLLRCHNHRWALLAVAAALLSCCRAPLPCRAGIPAGLGGWQWSTALPQSNTLHAVVAAAPGSDGTGLAAVGDASTLLFRRTPLGVGVSGWLCGRMRPVNDAVSYRGISVLRDGPRVAVAADDGSMLVGDGCEMLAIPVAKGPLNAVAWSVGSTGRLAVLVGENGEAFVYDDVAGKLSAASLDPTVGASADLLGLSFPAPQGVPGSVGFAVGRVPTSNGTRGVALKTVDGGRTWSALSNIPGADAYLSVSFVNPLRGFALGVANGTGTVVVTSDGGASWQPYATLDAPMRAIAAFDPYRAVVVGETGIETSQDGGAFKAEPEPVANLTAPIPLDGVDVAGTEAWAVGAGGVIFHSLDYGNTWEVFNEGRSLDQRQIGRIRAIQFASDKQVTAVGEDGTILQSTDGGATFSLQPNPSHETLFAIGVDGARNAGTGAPAANPVIPVGAHRTILTPGANGLQVEAGVPNVDYYAVSMYQASTGNKAWAVGQGGAIVFSDAGSPVWVPEYSGTANNLRAVQAVSLTTSGAYNVVAAGDGGVILRSTDGVHWGPILSGIPLTPLPYPFTTTNLRGIYFRTASLGFVVGDNGVIGRTTDGGRTWTVQQPTQGAGAFYAISGVPNGLSIGEIYVVGDHQAVLKSTDNGLSWNLLSPPVTVPGTVPDFPYRAVQAVQNGLTFIAGDQGHLLQTQTGGSSWTELGGTQADTYYALRMISPTTGMAAIDSVLTGPRVTFTTDGWTDTITAGLPAGPPVLFGADMVGQDAIVVGASGTILRTFDAASAAATFGTESGDIRAIASPASGQFIAAGDGGLLMRSVDGGATWQRIAFSNPFGPDLQIRAIGFGVPDALGNVTGFAGGTVPGSNIPVLFRTADSGQTWTPVPLDFGTDSAGINALSVFSSGALAAAANGAVYVFDGQAWTVQRPVPGFTGAWHAVSATDTRWYVVGDKGMCARFPDAKGNPQWQAVPTGTANNLYAISGPAATTGFFLRALGGTSGGGDSLRDDIRGCGGDVDSYMETETGGLAIFGDTNRDTVVNFVDARQVLQVVSGLVAPNLNTYFYGDVFPTTANPNAIPGDGYLDFRDAVQLFRQSMGF